MKSIFTLLLSICLCFISYQVAAQLVISEFHYQNQGQDVNEQIEIFGRAGTNLSGYRIALYDNDDEQYRVINCTGIIPQQSNYSGNWFGVLAFPAAGMEEGQGGIALINNLGDVMDFISYGGTIEAEDGLAEGRISDDIGVEESNSTPAGYALWRPNAASATFKNALPQTFGFVNTALLPINLKLFNVSRKSDQVAVKWTASNTHPESYYEVQRSSDQRNFETLARIRATGVGEFNYAYSDSKPVKGNAFYRLKLIDPDENTGYSHLARMKWTQKDLFINNIYPSFTRSTVQLQVNSDRNYTGTIEVFDVSGKLVKKKQIFVAEGNSNYAVPVHDLKSGSYVIRLRAGSEVLTGKFIRE